MTQSNYQNQLTDLDYTYISVNDTNYANMPLAVTNRKTVVFGQQLLTQTFPVGNVNNAVNFSQNLSTPQVDQDSTVITGVGPTAIFYKTKNTGQSVVRASFNLPENTPQTLTWQFSISSLRYSPVQIGSLNYWNNIAAGYYHAAAIQSPGTLWTWGNNINGQLGNNSLTLYSSSIQVGGLNTWTNIAAGQYHTVGVQANGSLWAWGYGGAGQLGSGGSNYSSPVQVLTNITAVSLGWNTVAPGNFHSLAIQTNGSLWAWGNNSYGQLGVNSVSAVVTSPVQAVQLGPWISAVAFSYTSLALQSNGTLWSWGTNGTGQLGLNTSTSSLSIPAQIGTSNLWTSIKATGSTVTGLVAAIQTPGTLWAWGYNQFGQLSTGDLTNRSSPVQVGALSNWTSVAVGINNMYGIQSPGTLWACGYNQNGAVGNNTIGGNTLSPVQVANYQNNWAKVSGGQYFTSAVTSVGTLWAWGLNSYGQLGTNSTGNTSSPVQVGAVSLWTIVSNGYNFAVALQTPGTLWAWGNNSFGQLGTSNQTNYSSPVQIGTTNYWNNIACGYYHTVAIQSPGTLWAWGLNTYGQIGLNTSTNYSSPVQIGTASNWTSIATGQYHTLAIQSPGTLWAWGLNSYGQLGTSNQTNYSSPVQIGLSNNWIQVSAGGAFTIAIKSPGTLWAWGLNSYGQLGTSNQTNYSSPVQLNIPGTWTSVVCGYNFTLAQQNTGTLWVWGGNSYGQNGQAPGTVIFSPTQIGFTGSVINTIAAGYQFGAAVQSGILSTWGANSYGQLGQVATGKSSVISPVYNSVLQSNWTSVSAGYQFAVAIQSPGTLWAWGLNGNNQLGNNSNQNMLTPVQIGVASTWTAVSCGFTHVIAQQANGTIWSWGQNNYGQAGTSNTTTPTTPVQIGSLSNTWSSIACGYYSSGGVTSPGTVWMWGLNSYGQLGQNNQTNYSSPVQIGFLSTITVTQNNWSQVAANNQYNVAIQSTGTLYSWGANNQGQLGLNTSNQNNYAAQIGTSSLWTAISCGYAHTVALQTPGNLWLWGYNAYGQLGNATTTNTSSPVQILNILPNWATLTSSGLGILGLQSNGTLWAWGPNSYGQLGNNSNSNSSTPTQIGNSSLWTRISGSANLSNSFVLAIQTPGTLWAWGDNNFGQLGNNSTGASYSPIQIGAVSTWIKISAGQYFAAAIQSNGTLWTWGSNSYGQLGISNQTNYSSPVQVGVNSNWAQISCGYASTMAIQSNGTLWGWGYGGYIGTSDQTNRYSPVQIGALSTWTSVITNNGSTFAIQSPGTLWACGYNSSGVLGLNDTTVRYSLVQVGSVSSWTSVYTSGNGTSGGIQSNGTLWTWGAGGNGQLGNGVVTNSSNPGQVGSLSNWSQVFLGYLSSFATQTPGTLWAWGYNAQGQLANNSTTNTSSPIQILGAVGTNIVWTRVSAGFFHTLAIQTPGTLWAWGRNDNYQLGNNSNANMSTPVQIGNASTWTAVTGGRFSSAGIQSNGTLWSWGLNTYGQLGVNTSQLTPVVSTPVQVGALTSWNRIACGYSFIVAGQTPGTLWAWGSNSYGQLAQAPYGNIPTKITYGL